MAKALATLIPASRDGVIYFRRPRTLLVITGPPFNKDRDVELTELARDFDGRKVICGGTTANIVSRLLNRPVHVALTQPHFDLPPAAEMEGIDLVTEGTVTLARTAEMLEGGPRVDPARKTPASDLVALMLQSDIVRFVVGTRINEAHQDPSMSVELDLRRNVVRKIATLLETRYLKECRIQFL